MGIAIVCFKISIFPSLCSSFQDIAVPSVAFKVLLKIPPLIKIRTCFETFLCHCKIVHMFFHIVLSQNFFVFKQGFALECKYGI